MKNIIFIAPPAAGKGTQSELLKEKYHMVHISTGDLLREEINKGTDLGNTVKAIMDQGELVSNEIITELLEKRLQESDCKNGFILDGYPRNVEQAVIYEAMLEKLKIDLGHVIFLDIDKETAKARILGRISCPNCNAIYNLYVEEMKPKVDGICDKCGKPLLSRSDDNEAAFDNRFDTYVVKTKPLIDYYQAKGVLSSIKINEDTIPDNVFTEIEKIIS